MDVLIEKEIAHVKKIQKNKRYWFIRTYGGDVYDDYLERGYVGLGLNNVPHNYIVEGKTNWDRLQTFIDTNTEYHAGSATRWANQLINFQHNVKVGDTVVMPDRNSDKFAFGEVQSDVFLVDKPGTFQHDGETMALPEKRRKISWDKVVAKDNVQTDLKPITNSHAGISNIDSYSEIIEGYISSLFIKEEHLFLILKVNQDEEINAFALSNFLTSITYFYKEYCIEHGIEYNEELFIKIKLQSKGTMALKAIAVAAGLAIAGIVALSNNSDLEVDWKQKTAKVHSDGFLKSLSDFLDRSQERKQQHEIFIDSIAKLKAERFRDSIELSDEIANKHKDGRK